MPRSRDDGRSWSRVEAVASVVRPPGWVGRTVATAVGAAAIGLGLYLAAQNAVAAPGGGAQAQGAPVVADPQAVMTACASIGITVAPGQYPVEGVQKSVVLRILDADPEGEAELIVPQALVIAVRALEDDELGLSIAVPSGPADDMLTKVSAANASGTLSLALTYDLTPAQVLRNCRV